MADNFKKRDRAWNWRNRPEADLRLTTKSCNAKSDKRTLTIIAQLPVTVAAYLERWETRHEASR